MPTMTVMRGVSGSGKSTWVRENATDDAIVASADEFFITEDGEYDFDPGQLGEAHDMCFAKVLDACCLEVDIFVDNTNMTLEEIAPYRMLARRYGYDIRYVRMKCPLDTAIERSEKAPAEAIERQAESFEGLPPYYEGEHTEVKGYDDAAFERADTEKIEKGGV